MKTATEVWNEYFKEWVMAGQIKTHAIPAMDYYAEQTAIKFALWVERNASHHDKDMWQYGHQFFTTKNLYLKFREENK